MRRSTSDVCAFRKTERGSTSKRGGARVVYFARMARDTLFLLDVYAKNEKENLTDADKKEIRRALAALRAEA